MSHPIRQRRRNGPFRVESLEPRALLSTATVDPHPAAAIAPRAPVAHVSRIAQDPEYTSKTMMGIGDSDIAGMQIRFFTRGLVTGKSTSIQRRDAFAGGQAQFNGTAHLEVTTNIFGTRKIKYTNGRAVLISPDNTTMLAVKFKGTEEHVQANVDKFELEGAVTGGGGLFHGLAPGGHFRCQGAFYRSGGEVGLGFHIQYP
jgi:hypothetical protein